MILPVAVLVGALVALNRLHTEQEIVICFAGGMSRWRVISPAVQLAGWVGLICLILTLWVQPLCYRALRQTLQGVRADIAASMIRPGKFSHPAPGVTVFAQTMDDDGTIHNLFIDRDTGNGRDNTFMARDGRLQSRGGAPMLVMRHGANQEFSKAGALHFLAFDKYELDLRPLMPPDHPVIYKLSDRYAHELFFPDLRKDWERANVAKMLAEGHSRIVGPLYSLAFMAMALTAVIGGSFSRLGYGARIGAVALAALVVRVAGFGAQAAAGSASSLNLAQYLIPLGCQCNRLDAVVRPSWRASPCPDTRPRVTASAARLQIYVLGRFFAGIGVAFAVIVVPVIVLIDFVELSRTLGGRFDLTFVDLLGLTLLKSPTVILLLLPFVFLFGTMGAFVTMNRRSELVAMRAAGVSAWKFIFPAAAAAFAIGLASTTALNPCSLGSERKIRGSPSRSPLQGPQAGPDDISGCVRVTIDSEVVIHARSHDTVDDVVRLRRVSVFIESVKASGELGFTRRLEADEARLTPGSWLLLNVKEALPGANSSVRSERISIPSMLDHRTAMEKFVSPGGSCVSGVSLPTIRAAELAGYSSTGYRLRLQQLLSDPLLLVAMSVLGAAFCLRLMRLGDLATLVGAGVTLGFVLFFLDEFCGALGTAGGDST